MLRYDVLDQTKDVQLSNCFYAYDTKRLSNFILKMNFGRYTTGYTAVVCKPSRISKINLYLCVIIRKDYWHVYKLLKLEF